MDLLDNVATELGFEFHLYVVRDHLFGAKKKRTRMDFLKNKKQSVNQHQPLKSADQTRSNDDHESVYKSAPPASSAFASHQQSARSGNSGYPGSAFEDADSADCKLSLIVLHSCRPQCEI